MDKRLTGLINSLNKLKATIDAANIHNTGFKAHGWNQVHLNKQDVSTFIENHISKLKQFGDKSLTEGLAQKIDSHVETINSLNSIAQSHFNNNAQHLLHVVPNILLTLNTVFDDINHELFSFENIQDKKLLPRSLATRLRNAKVAVDQIDENSSSLNSKINIINDAHEAAESLPTDLASLREAKDELSTLLNDARKELENTKKEIEELKQSAANYKSDASKACEETEKLRAQTEKHESAAKKLVDECDDALQITTTQGLAAGFDQKAKELKNSIWVWIAGLLIALISGAWIGADRVEAFTEILKNDLTAGQAILHSIMSLFSIGGPLWLAWISTQQINQRFKLSEDYSYKATVAKSFTGFKKFAERFEPETEERLFNSTLDRLDEMPLRLIDGKDYNSPWHEFTDSESFKKAITMFPSLAQEAGRFASKTSLKTSKTSIKTKNETGNRSPENDAELA
ncbi:hypothetical protein [Neptuniibacter sp.]|uniref:hypothetical protein n=1 Tax=Neptuniibacter sp. TaxID=1962643 RepID=UPI003B5CF514